MSSEPPRPDLFGPLLAPPPRLRLGLAGLAAAIALGGVWMLVCAVLAPRPVPLPLDRESAAAAAAHRLGARAAARLGVVRGDLFAQAAYSDAGLMRFEGARAPEPAGAGEVETARWYARTALALAPVNGAAWLFLAALPPAPAQAAGVAPEAAGLSALQMSYLTAPNEAVLAPARIERALAAAAPVDRDLQQFVKSDLRAVLSRRPAMKPALVAAYRAASPQNQAIFEALAADVDPAFSQSLRAGAAK